MNDSPRLEDTLLRLARLPAAERDAVIAALTPGQARALNRCLKAGAPGAWAATVQAAQDESPASNWQTEDAAALADIDLAALPAGIAATVLSGLPTRDRQRLAEHLPAEARGLLSSLATVERGALATILRQELLSWPGRPRRPITAQPAPAHASGNPKAPRPWWRPAWLSA